MVSERPGVSVAQVAKRLGESPRRVRHHLEALAEQGLIEQIAVRDDGGRRVRRFGMGPVLFEDLHNLDPEHQFVIAREIVRILLGDIAVATAAGTFAGGKDDLAVRIYGEVDDVCLRELTAIHERAYRETLDLMRDARREGPVGSQVRKEVVAALFFFEAPLWGRSRPDGVEADGPRTLAGTDWSQAGERHGFPVEPSPEEMEALVEAMTHELRGRVLIALADRPRVSIRELAVRLGEPPHRVRHALDALLSAGLVVVTDELVRGGVVERRYAARPWSADKPGLMQPPLARAVLRLLIDDLTVAADAGKLGTWANEYEARYYSQLDEAARSRMAEVFRRAYFEILKAVEAGRERVRQRGEPGTEIVSAFFLFEAPLWRGKHLPA